MLQTYVIRTYNTVLSYFIFAGPEESVIPIALRDYKIAKASEKQTYMDLVVILAFICACVPFLVLTPSINETSSVPTENKIVNGVGLLIVVLLLIWSLAFKIIWMIPRCKQRCFVRKNGPVDGESGAERNIFWHPCTQ